MRPGSGAGGGGTHSPPPGSRANGIIGCSVGGQPLKGPGLSGPQKDKGVLKNDGGKGLVNCLIALFSWVEWGLNWIIFGLNK